MKLKSLIELGKIDYRQKTGNSYDEIDLLQFLGVFIGQNKKTFFSDEHLMKRFQNGDENVMKLLSPDTKINYIILYISLLGIKI